MAALVGVALVVVAAGVVLLPQPDGARLAVYSLSLLMTALSTRWIMTWLAAW